MIRYSKSFENKDIISIKISAQIPFRRHLTIETKEPWMLKDPGLLYYVFCRCSNHIVDDALSLFSSKIVLYIESCLFVYGLCR